MKVYAILKMSKPVGLHLGAELTGRFGGSELTPLVFAAFHATACNHTVLCYANAPVVITAAALAPHKPQTCSLLDHIPQGPDDFRGTLFNRENTSPVQHTYLMINTTRNNPNLGSKSCFYY